MPLHRHRPFSALPATATVPQDGTPPGFSCTTHVEGRDAAWIHASGELDLASSPQLGKALDEAQTQARLVVLDLCDLTFMDIPGVHTIMEASIYARLAGHRLVVLRAPREIQAVFDLTGTADALESHSLELQS